MDCKTARPAPAPEQLEVCVNLWWFLDNDSGLVFRVSGRGYALAGDDDDKLSILRSLAMTDFHVAENHKVHDRFTLNSEHGTIKGVVPGSLIKSHSDIFEPVYLSIEKNLPKQAKSIEGEYHSYTIQMPKDPLSIVTCVIEGSDGSLIPLISNSN